MEKLKFELFITINTKQHIFVVGEEPLILGSTADADMRLEASGAPVKATFEVIDNALVVKAFDPNYPIKIQGKLFKSAKLKKSVFFKIGSIDVILSVEHVYADNVSAEKAMPLIEEVFDQTVPDFQLPETEPHTQKISSTESVVGSQLSQVIVEPETSHDPEVFNIKFNEALFKPSFLEVYSIPSNVNEDYIELRDETEKIIPSPDIVVEKQGLSLHIVHMNNGAVLDEGFYSTKIKRLYVSDDLTRKKIFKAHDCGFKKQELVFMKDEQVSVVNMPNYTMTKVSNGKTFSVDAQSCQLLPDERVVLTKGTSQIVLRLSSAVPRVKSGQSFMMDEDLLRSLAYAWAVALFFLLNVLVVDSAKKKNTKPVVIYKTIEMKKLKQKEQPKVAATEKKLEVEEAKPQKAEVAKEKPQEKIVKKQAVKKPQKKLAQKQKAAKKIVKKPAPAKIRPKSPKVANKKQPKPKKTYKFNFASSLSANTASASPRKLKSAKRGDSVDIAGSMSSSSRVTASIDSSSAPSETKIARFAAGSLAGKQKMMGTKGLSDKTSSNTAYIASQTKVLGALDPNLIRKIMEQHISQFRYCYQKELLTNPSVSGVFDVSFKINRYGKGVKAAVKSHGKGFSKKGTTCIKRVIDIISFPRPKNGGFVDVSLPMNFYSNNK